MERLLPVELLIASAFVATIGEPARFKKSRMTGVYPGFIPRVQLSGKSNLSLGGTKCDDRYMRSAACLSAAKRILASNAADSDLRRFGERIVGDGGRRTKARARIAVARKLGVLLH